MGSALAGTNILVCKMLVLAEGGNWLISKQLSHSESKAEQNIQDGGITPAQWRFSWDKDEFGEFLKIFFFLSLIYIKRSAFAEL